MNFLSQQDSGKLVLAQMTPAVAIYPISQNNVLAAFWPKSTKEKELAVEQFFSSDCQEKQKIINHYKINYVYHKLPISCDFKTIYSKGIFIYDTKQ